MHYISGWAIVFWQQWDSPTIRVHWSALQLLSAAPDHVAFIREGSWTEVDQQIDFCSAAVVTHGLKFSQSLLNWPNLWPLIGTIHTCTYPRETLQRSMWIDEGGKPHWKQLELVSACSHLQVNAHKAITCGWSASLCPLPMNQPQIIAAWVITCECKYLQCFWGFQWGFPSTPIHMDPYWVSHG